MSQAALFPGVHPDRLIERVVSEHSPIATVCLFSGGHDSCVLAHRCRESYDRLAFIDTGTAVPGVREFVESYAEWIGKPLAVFESGDAFRRMVLGGYTMSNGKPAPALGFPGPAQHGRAYSRLKERQIERILADAKIGQPRSARVLFLTGVRRAESARRANRQPVTRRFSAVFCNPLIDWSDADMRDYRREHEIPESDVAALLHRSGECNCGAFAARGEREELRALWPEWFDRTIGSLEREAEAAGIGACRWGERPAEPDYFAAVGSGPLCTDCQLRIEAEPLASSTGRQA